MIEMLEGHWEKFKAMEKLQDVLSSGICKQYGITQTAFQIINKMHDSIVRAIREKKLQI